MHLSRLIHTFSDLSVYVCLFAKGWCSENGGVETTFCAPQRITNIQSLGKTLASEWVEYKIEKYTPTQTNTHANTCKTA